MESNLTNLYVYYSLTSFALLLPQLVVIIIGIVFSVMKRSKNSQGSKFALLGLGVMLLFGLLGLAFSIIPIWFQAFSTIALIIRFFVNIVWAVGLGILIYAVWTERDEK